MHGVASLVFGKVGTQRAGGGFFRVGRAHECAVTGDGILAAQHLHHHRAGGHEFDQFGKKRTFAVNVVETGGIVAAKAQHFGGDDFQAVFFEAVENGAGMAVLHGIGFDDGERHLRGHGDSVKMV